MGARVLADVLPHALDGAEHAPGGRRKAIDPARKRGHPGAANGVALTQVFDGWKNYHFTPAEAADPLVSGFDADTDGDGIATLMEFALGLDPKAIALPKADLRFEGLAPRIRTELEIGLVVLAYARQAHGGQLNPRLVSRNFDRTPPKLDTGNVLRRLAETESPVNEYEGLNLPQLLELMHDLVVPDSVSRMPEGPGWCWPPRST